MFDDSHRLSFTVVVVDMRSIIMAILWLSFLILVFHFIRRQTRMIQNFGIATLVIMLGLMLIRSFAPLNFAFTLNIPSTFYGNINYFFSEYELFHIPGTNFSITPSNILLVIWGVGTVVSLLLFFIRTRKALKKFQSTVCEPLEQEQRALDEVQKEFKKHRNVKLYRAMVITPLTYGYFRSTILIPIGKQYTERELYCVFLHELTHHYHRDAWTKLLVQILCSLLWWNPLVYLFQKDVTQTVELHCDASVCSKLTPIEQTDYLNAITNTMKIPNRIAFPGGQKAGVVSGFAGDGGKEQMQQRLKILSEISLAPKHKKLYYFFVCLLMAAVIALSYLFIFNPMQTQYGQLQEMAGNVAITKENSYLLEFPEGCYFLYQDLRDADGEGTYSFAPLDDENMVRQALNDYQLEVRSVDKAGFIEFLAEAGSEDPQAEYIFWAYMYFPDLLTEEERAAFRMPEN